MRDSDCEILRKLKSLEAIDQQLERVLALLQSMRAILGNPRLDNPMEVADLLGPSLNEVIDQLRRLLEEEG